VEGAHSKEPIKLMEENILKLKTNSEDIHIVKFHDIKIFSLTEQVTKNDVNLSEGHALMEGKPWGTEYLYQLSKCFEV
jgi:hypothetical protein